MVVVVEIPAAIPGTFWVTFACLNAAGSVPPEVASTIAVKGPAPSWLHWCMVMEISPASDVVGRPLEAP